MDMSSDIIDRWMRRWEGKWINRHTNGWLDRQKDSSKSRWTDSHSDRETNILMAGDYYTTGRKIMYDAEGRQKGMNARRRVSIRRQRARLCKDGIYVCVYEYMYFRENNVVVYIFTSFIHMGLSQTLHPQKRLSSHMN